VDELVALIKNTENGSTRRDNPPTGSRACNQMKSIIVILPHLYYRQRPCRSRCLGANYDHALEKAKQGKKLVMVDIYTEWWVGVRNSTGMCTRIRESKRNLPRVLWR
jgi:hypothetical protein